MADEPKKFWRLPFKPLLLGFFSLCIISFYGYILLYPINPLLARQEAFSYFERHNYVSSNYPYAMSYYLMLPEDYAPSKRYPLIMLLHGSSRHMVGAKALMSSERRKKYPVIAYLPIAPPFFCWSNPFDVWSPVPEALPMAMKNLEEIKSSYSVDEKRIYITGYSMGGTGTFAALRKYQGTFAAAVIVAPVWNTKFAKETEDIPIWVFQGSEDKYASSNRSIVKQLQKVGLDVQFTEYEGKGHAIWNDVYKDDEMWDWLLLQKK